MTLSGGLDEEFIRFGLGIQWRVRMGIIIWSLQLLHGPKLRRTGVQILPWLRRRSNLPQDLHSHIHDYCNKKTHDSYDRCSKRFPVYERCSIQIDVIW
jgi:hypothetical protein